MSLPKAKLQQQLARREYRRVKRHSNKYRITFRENLADAIATHQNISRKSVIRDMINREETREMHRRIKWMRHKYHGQRTSAVIMTHLTGKKRLIVDKHELETVIMHENEKKFTKPKVIVL